MSSDKSPPSSLLIPGIQVSHPVLAGTSLPIVTLSCDRRAVEVKETPLVGAASPFDGTCGEVPGEPRSQGYPV
ncbi:hypothetical protein BDW69DRAFT_160854, partial [Aspergillus filifer]